MIRPEVAVVAHVEKMVGFRNVAIHECQAPEFDIVPRVVVDHLDFFLAFLRLLLRP